jgi:hypothetical protein
MHIIAFSWSSRTGKSTAIATMKALFEQQGKKVKVFGETAQIYIDRHPGPIEDRYAFEHFIMEEEIKRLYEMKEIKATQEYDIALADRTFLDAFVYIYRAIIHGHITNPDLLSHTKEIELSKDIYDVIVFFDTMIKPDKNFVDYNEMNINAIFKHTMESIYGEKIAYYPNNTEFQKDREKFLTEYIQ